VGAESIWRSKEGTLITIEANMALLKDAYGNAVGAVASIRDITERKRAEEALKLSEEKYRSLIENANDTIMSVNDEGIIIEFNKKGEEIFGYTRDEVIGNSVHILAPLANREQRKEAFKKFVTTAKGVLPRLMKEGKGLRKDGQEIFILDFASIVSRLF
jgi:PAS domain S-box-containing protein